MTDYFELAKGMMRLEAERLAPPRQEGERTVHQISLSELTILIESGPYRVDRLSANCVRYFFKTCDVYELINSAGVSVFFEIPVA